MKIPKHIAIIPDGNRRWAKLAKHKPWEGHSEGVMRFWDVSQSLFDLGLEHLTIWAASYDNLQKRSRIEINYLMNLLRKESESSKVLDMAKKNQVRVSVKGEWKTLVRDPKVIEQINKLVEETKHFKKGVLTLLFAYDGKREMLDAINSLVKSKKIVSDENLCKELWTGDLPPVDFVIRTGGEPHWSAGFMMWHTANSQFYFTNTLWPDFKDQEIKKALADYESRERRLGK